MPEIGRDKGIIYFIHLEAVGRQRHSLPHVHARYQNTEISIDFDGNIIAGELIPSGTSIVEVKGNDNIR